MQKQLLEFGPFRLDPEARVLFRDGQIVPLSPKIAHTLVLLVEQNGKVVSRDELLRMIWPDTNVEEGNLTHNISVLRKVFSDGGLTDDLIRTIPKRGYSFGYEVRSVPEGEEVRKYRYRRIAGVLLATTVLVACVVWYVRPKPPPPGNPLPPKNKPVLTQLTFGKGLSAYPSLSADGSQIVYSSDSGSGGSLNIWIRPLSGGEPRRITTSEYDETEPVLSPNGRLIAYRAERDGGGLYVIAAEGGTPRLLAGNGRGPRFSPDGRQIAYWVTDPQTGFGKGYWLPVEGGAPMQVLAGFDDLHDITWTPDGKWLVVCGTRASRGSPLEGHDFWFIPRTVGEPVKSGIKPYLDASRITVQSTTLPFNPIQIEGGQLQFVASWNGATNLFRMPIPQIPGRYPGPVHQVTSGQGTRTHSWRHGRTSVLAELSVNLDVWSVAIDADQARVSGPPVKVTQHPSYDLYPSVDVAGRNVVFLSGRSGNPELWTKDLQEGTERSVSKFVTAGARLKVSADGRSVIMRRMEGSDPKKQAIYVVDLATGAARVACQDCGAPTHWSADRRYVLFEPGWSISRIHLLEVESGKTSDLIVHPRHGVHAARFSLDGKWVAFYLNRGTDGTQVMVAPFSGPFPIAESRWIAVTEPDVEAYEPYWAPSGKWVYYLATRGGHRSVWAQALNEARLPVGKPVSILPLPFARLSALSTLRLPAAAVGLSVARNRLVVSLAEIEGNLWKAESIE